MRAGRVLLVSVTVHAALFGALAMLPTGGGLVVPPAPAPRVTLVEPPVFDVVVLDEPAASSPAVAAAAPAPSPRSPGRAPTEHIAAAAEAGAAESHGQATGGLEPGQVDSHGPGTGMMKMRGPDLGLAPGTAERIVATSRPLAETPKSSGKLQDAPGGRAVTYDEVTTMSVDPDGTAHFDDQPDIDIKLKLPIPHLDFEKSRQDLGKALTEWFADPYAATRYGRKSEVANWVLAAPGSCDSFGDVWCEDPYAPKMEKDARAKKKTTSSLIGGSGKFDITSYLQRKYVGDPYSSRKLKLLDDTRDERVARGTKFRKQQLARASELVARNLARVTAAMSAAERKQALFELWDECSEGEGPEGEAGQRARAFVLGFIRKHLPVGSAEGYSDAEIAALLGEAHVEAGV